VFGLSSEDSVKSFRHDSGIQNFYFAAGLGIIAAGLGMYLRAMLHA
jgi:hypothetical protein